MKCGIFDPTPNRILRLLVKKCFTLNSPFCLAKYGHGFPNDLAVPCCIRNLFCSMERGSPSRPITPKFTFKNRNEERKAKVLRKTKFRGQNSV